MSWDVVFRSPSNGMGTKEQVRESFLSACERITGQEVPRRGPTEVRIDDSFSYEVLFIGHKRAIESFTLAIKTTDGDPQADPTHPARGFLRQLAEQTGWSALDTTTGAEMKNGG